MTRVSLLLGLALATLLVPALGCGGAPKGGKSLAQQYQDALKITDGGQRARKLADLAKKHKAAGDVIGMGAALSAAKEAALSVKDPGSKSSALINVAAASAALDQSTDNIKSLLREAGKSIEAVADPDVRVPLLADLAAATGTHLKNQAAAEAHLKTAEAAADQVSGNVTKVIALAKIAVAYGKLQSSADSDRVLTGATEFARGLTDPRQKCDCLAEIAVALAGMQRADESKAMFTAAQEAAAEITDAENQGHALLNLARKATAVKNKSLASTLLDQAAASAGKVTDSGARAPLLEEIAAERKSS